MKKIYLLTFILALFASCQKENLTNDQAKPINSLKKSANLNFGTLEDFTDLKKITKENKIKIPEDQNPSKNQDDNKFFLVDTSKIVKAKIGNNSYYTLGVIGKNSTQNKYFENIVIGQMENGETTYYLFRYYFNNKIYNNQDEINISSLEKAEMKPLNSLNFNLTKGYDCITSTTTYCDWGGETHIAGPNCSTTYTSRHTYCIQTVDYYTYSDFINSGGGGDSNGGNGPENDFIDPNDPYTQPIITSEMYAGALNYHLQLNTVEYNWALHHTTDASQILEFLDNENFSTSSKNFAANLVSIYSEMGGAEEIKSIIASGVTNTAEYIHQLYLRLSNLVAQHPEYLTYTNCFVDIVRKTAATLINTNPSSSDWIDLTNMWLFELGTNPINFIDGNYTVSKLKNLEGVNQVRQLAKNNLNSGILYSSKQWTYGQTEFYTGLSEANLATSFLGTYTVKVTAIIITGKQYKLNYSVTNTSSWASATRLRIDYDNDKSHDAIIPSKPRGTGLHLGGNFKQNWNWSETVIRN